MASSSIARHAGRFEAGIIIDASNAHINVQGDAFSHNTVNVLPPPPQLTAEEKEKRLASFQRCPLPSVIFTGREEALRKICDRLLEPSTRTRVFVLYGLGGAGKSQIAFQFVHTHCFGKDINVAPRIPIALFIDASTKDTIELSLANIAAATGMGESPDDILRFLPRVQQEWLLFFNNADDPELDLNPYFPHCMGGNILITTRNARDTARQYTDKRPSSSYEVGKMTSEDAALMLRRATGKEEGDISDSVHALTKELGFLPLAIAQAGAAIQRRESSIEDYRQQLNIHSAQLFENDRVRPQDLDGYNQSVYTTWYSNYRSLTKAGRSLFNICAFLHHDGITEDIFSRAAVTCSDPNLTFSIPLDDATSRTLQEVKDLLMNFINPLKGYGSFRFKDLIGEIRSYSLVQTQLGSYSIHPLVQTWAQKLASDGIQQQTVLLLGLSLLNTEVIGTKLWRSLIPHLDEVLKGQIIIAIPDFATFGFGLILFEAGRYRDAAVCSQYSVERKKKFLGEKHPTTLAAITNLAVTLGNLGRQDEARELEIEVLEGRKQILGEKHPDTLMAMGNLAGTLGDLGKWDEARELGLEVLGRSKEILGEKHPQTLIGMANLAGSLQSLGRWDEAKELEIEVLEGRKQILGEKHPDTLAAMTNLAGTLRALGRQDEARELETEVLEMSKEILGEKHPQTLAAMGNLAVSLRNLGRWDEAKELEIEVLEGRKQILGEKHPDTLTAMANLAITLRNLRKWDEARDLGLEVLEGRKQILGEKHPDTLAAMKNVANTLGGLGKWDEARELGLEVLGRSKEILGEKHPQTLIAMGNLAVTLRNLGRWDEVKKLETEVLEGRKQTLGEKHPETLTAMGNLAATLQNFGECNEARELEIEVLERSKKILGEKHPQTLIAMGNLAATLQNLERWDEARELQTEALEGRKQILGEKHPDTLAAMTNLAITLWNLGRQDEARELGLEALERSKEILGELDPDTQVAVGDLEDTLQNLQKWDEVRKLETEVLEERTQNLGEELEARGNPESAHKLQLKQRDKKTLLGKLKRIICCLDQCMIE